MPVPGSTGRRHDRPRFNLSVARRLDALEIAISHSVSGDDGGDGGGDHPFVKTAGDTMTGNLNINAGASQQALAFGDSGAFMAWYANDVRTGYLQGNGANGLYLNAEMGELGFGSASGYVRLPRLHARRRAHQVRRRLWRS